MNTPLIERPIRFATNRYITVALAILTVSGCTGLPKRGNDRGIVTLGHPEVHMRERHITDRFADVEWLRDQLSEENLIKYEQGLQGDITTVLLKELGFALEAKFDPEIPSVPSDSAAGDNSANAATAAEPGSGAEPENQTDSATDEAEQNEDDDPKKEDRESILTGRNIESVLTVLGSLPDSKAIQLTPAERFDDLLAFRDNVRAEIRQRTLDDSHDLNGNTLYELTFDLSFLPGEDSGWPVMVVVDVPDQNGCGHRVEECKCTNAGTVQDVNGRSDFAKDVDRLVEKLAYTELERRILRYTTGTYSIEDSFWVSSIKHNARAIAVERGNKFGATIAQSLVDAQAQKTASLSLSNAIIAANSKLESDNILGSYSKMIGNVKSGEYSFDESLQLTPTYSDRLSSKTDWSVASYNELIPPSTGAGSLEINQNLFDAALKMNRSELVNATKRFEEKTKSTSEKMLIIEQFVHEICTIKQWPVTAILERAGNELGVQFKADTEAVDKRLKRLGGSIRVVDVSPRELNERLSVRARSLVSRAASVIGSGTIESTADTTLNFESLREELVRIDTIESNPILIGFSHGPGIGADATKSFGWLIGPSYESRQPPIGGGVTEWYRHTGMNQSVTATIIVPASQEQVLMNIRAYQLTSKGIGRDLKARFGETRLNELLPVPLPQDPMAAARSIIYGQQSIRSGPLIIPRKLSDEERSKNEAVWTLRSGEEGNLVLRGENTWRNPRVYLAGKPADSIEILPGLDGLQARWDKVPVTASTNPGGVKVDLVIASSQGQDVLAKSVLVLPARKKVSLPNFTASIPSLLVAKDDGELIIPIKFNTVPGKGILVTVTAYEGKSRSTPSPIASEVISQFDSRYYNKSTKTLESRLHFKLDRNSTKELIIIAEISDANGAASKRILDKRVVVFSKGATKFETPDGIYGYNDTDKKITSGLFMLTWPKEVDLAHIKALYSEMDGIAVQLKDGRSLTIKSRKWSVDDLLVPVLTFTLGEFATDKKDDPMEVRLNINNVTHVVKLAIQ